MKNLSTFHFYILGFFLLPFASYAQEKIPEINIEESAEVFLEEYSNEFEEAFFEALKQKGIENFDRAINLLLECKRLDEENFVVDHELAKAYFANKNYRLAQEYGITALTSEPENMWYLNTLVKILEIQNSSFESLKLKEISKNLKLKENLVFIYYKKKRYAEALAVLNTLKKTSFLKDLESKINDSIDKRDKKAQKQIVASNTSQESTSLIGYKKQIQDLINTNDQKNLKQIATDALENFPSQPYFYYAQGYVHNKEQHYNDAIEILEAAFDYLVDDVALANKIFAQLSEAYNGVNNSVKANMYLSKIKPGF